ncbi:Bgt-20377 [Blumeria graminis f. sp. tritici]|uniref:Bgt-20377 n=2 Tax=Blumeria graminis f. sp. tritici TaxID=62690 RepID=A0A381L0R9_BLUGR|nr:Bgt-20377 [Blumeria graminis f. sp. tritici]
MHFFCSSSGLYLRLASKHTQVYFFYPVGHQYNLRRRSPSRHSAVLTQNILQHHGSEYSIQLGDLPYDPFSHMLYQM